MANQRAIKAAGLSLILEARIPDVPYVVARWRREHPGQDIPDGHVFTRPCPGGATDRRRDQVIYYQYWAGRARRTLRGIDGRVARAEKAVAGKAAVKRNRFIGLFGGIKTVSRVLEAKARNLADLKGYVTNLAACPDGSRVTAEFVTGTCHRLFQIGKSFSMSKHDLPARPICHQRRDSIEAHLTIVFAALAVSRWIEEASGWTIRKLVRAGTPLPDDRDPRRRTHPYRRRPPARRRQRRPRAASTSTQVRTNLAQLRLQMMIKLMMPKAKWLVVVTCLAVIAGLTALTIPIWIGSVVSASPGKPAIMASGAVDSELEALLDDGGPNSATSARHTSNGSALVAAAAGADNQQFYQLGELLVRDGLSDTIINLSREMNGWWYEWSEWHAPSSELDAFILAWRQVVTTMRSVPGEHFKFLWTIYPKGATVAECWPGSAYVDYVGTDILDWYGGPNYTYPHTASGALDWTLHWQQTVTAVPGGLDWIAQFSKLTGKPIIIPEWGLDFHAFGGQDDTYFLAHMTAWLKAHHAIGLYWVQGHVTWSGWPGGPLLADVGASAQGNSPGAVNGMGKLLGGHLQYAGVYLQDHETISDATAQPVLAPWEHAGYRLVLSVDIIPNPPIIKSYSGPPEPGNKPYQLSNYPDAAAALKQGLG